MGRFNEGDKVTVVRDNYPEPESRSFIGSTGHVIGSTSKSVSVHIDSEGKPFGFEPNEIEHTRR